MTELCQSVIIFEA